MRYYTKDIMLLNKYNKLRKIFILYIVLILINFQAFSQSERKYLRQGNSKYYEGNFNDSEILYRKALEKNNSSTSAIFNLGDALYRQNKFEDASKQFMAASELENNAIKKSESYYNLGNSLLKANKIAESIDAYKNSLRLNPQNMKAKYNLAYAQDLLKQQQQQQQQQQNQDKQKGDQDMNDKNENKGENNNQQVQKEQNQQQQQENQQQNQQAQQQQGISKEDAERILEALSNNERKVQEKVREAKAAEERVKTLINW